jgi:hypothetical protein
VSLSIGYDSLSRTYDSVFVRYDSAGHHGRRDWSSWVTGVVIMGLCDRATYVFEVAVNF